MSSITATGGSCRCAESRVGHTNAPIRIRGRVPEQMNGTSRCRSSRFAPLWRQCHLRHGQFSWKPLPENLRMPTSSSGLRPNSRRVYRFLTVAALLELLDSAETVRDRLPRRSGYFAFCLPHYTRSVGSQGLDSRGCEVEAPEWDSGTVVLSRYKCARQQDIEILSQREIAGHPMLPYTGDDF
jgi:hypothetical protein